MPPYGACLLGSLNLTKYVVFNEGKAKLSLTEMKEDIPHIVRAMDNIVDRAIYPLPEQKESAQSKRRMGLGLTGVANTGEVLGYAYGSKEFKDWLELVMSFYRDEVYKASIELSKEKGQFPLLDKDQYLLSSFALTLPESIRQNIKDHGIRNSHLLSIAPTGTISLSADNVSSGIEPPFSLSYTRTYQTFEGPKQEVVKDYAYNEWGIEGKTALETSVMDHVEILGIASKYVDSACSKTCNVGDSVTWDEFKQVYMKAFDMGASGCTTFRASGKRAGILAANSSEDTVEEEVQEDNFVNDTDGAACYFDPSTGKRTCE